MLRHAARLAGQGGALWFAAMIGEPSRIPRLPAPWRRIATIALGLVLAASAATALTRAYAVGQEWPLQDYYQFRGVGQLAGSGVTDVYSDDARKRLAAVLRAAAERQGSEREIAAAANWPVLETYSSPFLYALFGRLSTNDYDLDASVWQIVGLVTITISIIVLGLAYHVPRLAILVLLALVAGTSAVLLSDIRTGNVTQVQVGLLAFYLVLRARWQSPIGDIGSGALLGLAIVFKFNIALIAVLLLTYWLLEGRSRLAIRQVLGMGIGGVAAVLVGAVAWGTPLVWLDWLQAVSDLGGQAAYTVADGNYAVARLVVERSDVGIAAPLFVVLIAAALLAMIAGRGRNGLAPQGPTPPGSAVAVSQGDGPSREALVLGLGVGIVLLASPLSFLYYFLLLIPLQVCLLGRTPGADPRAMLLRYAVVAVSMVLMAGHGVADALGMSWAPELTAWQAVAAAAVLSGAAFVGVARPGLRTASSPVMAMRAAASTPGPERTRRRPTFRPQVSFANAQAALRNGLPRAPRLGRSSDADLGRFGRVAIGLVVAAPMVVSALTLLPEVTIRVPNLNDDAFQYLLINRMSEALASGRNPLDFWMPQLELGFPQAFYYQHLPHLFVVLLDRVTFGVVDLFTMFNVVRFILMVGLPMTVFWSMRRMGFSFVASGIAAAVSPLFAGAFRYGLEYDSYVWRGWGMFTQLWGVHLSFVALATVHRVLERGSGYRLAVIAVAALVLSHFIYAYMMAFTLVLITVIGSGRATVIARGARLAIVGVIALAVSAYQWLPFVTTSQYLSASPYLEAYKYDSFGAGSILGWLLSGDLFDHGRVPVLTILFGLGIVVAILRRSRLDILALVGSGFWLVLYFGRPTLGPLFDLFPLHDGLLIHQFIGSLEIFAVLVMGLGGELIWTGTMSIGSWLAHRDRRAVTRGITPWTPLAAVMIIALISPAMTERAAFYRVNANNMRTAAAAIDADADLREITATIGSLPSGRVYAGLRKDWGADLALGSLNVRDVLTFDAVAVAGPPYQGLSLNSSLIWWTRYQDLAHLDLLDVRYVITPSTLAVPDFYRKVKQAGRYALYQVPASGVARYVTVTSRQAMASKLELFDATVAWFQGEDAAADRFVRYDYLSAPGPLSKTGDCGSTGSIRFSSADESSILATVACDAEGDLMLKVTYHPNWRVSVDGIAAETFMVSPSYVGVHLPAGIHQVKAVYEAAPAKWPLLLVGLFALLVVLGLGDRLDRIPRRLVRRPRDEVEPVMGGPGTNE